MTRVWVRRTLVPVLIHVCGRYLLLSTCGVWSRSTGGELDRGSLVTALIFNGHRAEIFEV